MRGVRITVPSPEIYPCAVLSGVFGRLEMAPKTIGAVSMSEQPMPTPGGQPVTPVARELFASILSAQEQKGIAEYGTTLTAWNGRDAFRDALEEMTDAFQYVVQCRMEHDDLIDEIVRLRGLLAELEKSAHGAIS